MEILKLRLLFINLMVMICLGYATDVYAPKPLKTIMTEVIGKQWTPSLINTIENPIVKRIVGNNIIFFLSRYFNYFACFKFILPYYCSLF